jgi:hypothetical protein
MQFTDGSFVENIELRTSSPETIMDGDLNRFKNLNGREAFLSILNSLMENELTNDFWTTYVAGSTRKFISA